MEGKLHGDVMWCNVMWCGVTFNVVVDRATLHFKFVKLSLILKTALNYILVLKIFT